VEIILYAILVLLALDDRTLVTSIPILGERAQRYRCGLGRGMAYGRKSTRVTLIPNCQTIVYTKGQVVKEYVGFTRRRSQHTKAGLRSRAFVSISSNKV
jgi:hypothetical protein